MAVTRVLLGEAPPRLEPMVASDVGAETVHQVARFQRQFWRCMGPEPMQRLECELTSYWPAVAFSKL
jgi:histone deacetylase 6